MPQTAAAFARRGAACLAVAAALGGCASSSSSTSAVTATGTTLDIYLSEPAHLSADPAQTDVAYAEELAFTQQSAEVKDFKLRLIVVHRRKLSDNARAAIQDESAIAYLGELAPGASEQTAGINNALDLLSVSPTDNALELTQATGAVPGAPSRYYEDLSSYGHTFARVVPSSAQEAAFAVSLIKSLGAGSVYVASDSSDYGRAIAHAVAVDAASASLTVTSSKSGADAIFYGSAAPAAAARFFNEAATVDPNAKLIGTSALDAPAFTSALSAAASSHTYITSPGFLPDELDASGRAFRSTFETDYRHEPSVEAIFGYAAMSAVLHAIAVAGTEADSRAKVIKDFLAIRRLPSVLGPYSIDKSGNTSLSSFVVLRPGASSSLNASSLATSG